MKIGCGRRRLIGGVAEKNRRGDGAQTQHSTFVGRRIVAAFAALQPVAARIVAEGQFVLPPLRQRFAEREAQVDTVRLVDPRRGLLRPHAGDFLPREAVALELRQSPVGCAASGAHQCGGSVGIDRLCAASCSPQRTAHRQV